MSPQAVERSNANKTWCVCVGVGGNREWASGCHGTKGTGPHPQRLGQSLGEVLRWKLG